MKKLLIAVSFGIAATLSSCTKEFEKINTDPNKINSISPGTLLNPIIYNVTAFNNLRFNDMNGQLMQVSLPFPSVSGGLHRYELSEAAGNSTWSTYYRYITNVKEMYKASVEAQDANYQAIAMTLNAWLYSNLTDAFGDIPMEEAARGDEGILRPEFNTQQEVYTKLISDLDSANKLYSTKSMTYVSDILYANKKENWRKFTNSLRMRLLMRVSKRTEMRSLELLREMVDNPADYPVFSSNADAAILQISGVTPMQSPWGRAIDFTTFRASSKFFLDNLNDWSDPRISKFATQARDKDGNAIGYKGIPSGYNNDATFDFVPSNQNIALVTAPMVSVIMSYAEVEFIKSELKFREGNMDASKGAYEKGVKASIEQWGANMPADYFNNEKAAFNNTLDRIMLQKYYALFWTDWQQWFEYRRTGLPELPMSEGMMNDGKMPVRYRYPVTVQNLNTENYQEAVNRMGGDDINVKVWWEK
jgi:hypothetical protein